MATPTDALPQETRADYDTKYSHKYDFNVTMSCSGCSNAIKNVLKKSFQAKPEDGKELDTAEKQKPQGDYHVNLEKQTVEVWSNDVDYPWTLGKIAGTKKKVNSGSADGQPQSIA